MRNHSYKELENIVLDFVTTQPGYNDQQHYDISILHAEAWIIIYGDSVQTGIAGGGNSFEAAYNDFIIKWHSFNGFTWLNKMKTLIR